MSSGEPDASTWAADEDDETDSLLRAIASAPPMPIAPISPGVLVAGKYRIEAPLGRGGMGMVWRARDERLDRALAIKFQLGARGEVERLRFEARALAALSHPNVVTVLEVGTHEGAMYIAMELVDGGNAREWVEAQPRHWREVVALYRQAGEGLVAAHGVGIVHRDFKPDNVLVGRDGRVRVADFGLARLGTGEPLPIPPLLARPRERDTQASSEVSPDLPGHRTRTDAVVGTPAYMAPEQLATSRVDVRADQFAFCVALYEALYAERPFRSLAALSTDRAVPHPSDDARAPRWVLRVLLRGLERDPTARWPSLAELLVRLDPRRRRRAWIPTVAVGASVLALAAAWPRGEDTDRCAEAGSIDDVWNGDRVHRVEQALHATQVPGIETAWRRLGPRLGEHASAWTDAWREACATADEHMLDVRLACLRARKSELAALVDLLAQTDADTARAAATIDAGLGDPAECLSAELADVAVPAASVAADVAALREVLASARAQEAAGRFAYAAALLDPLVVRVHALGYRPLIAEALLERGVLRGREHRDAEALVDLQDALAIALGERLDGIALGAASQIPAALHHLERDREALDACGNGDALAARWPALVEARIRLELACGMLHVHLHELDAADRRMQTARDLAAGIDDGGALQADALEGLARVEARRGRFADAVAREQRVLAILEPLYGDEHPRVALALEARGYFLTGADRRAEARSTLERALRIHERSAGREHPAVSRVLLLLAQLDSIEGDDASALARLERARAIDVRADGDDDRLTDIEGSIAFALGGLGRFAESLEAHRRQLERIEQRLGDDHPDLRYPLNNMALAGQDCGRSDDAELWLRRAIAIDDAQPAHDPFSPTLHFDLGFLLLARGELEAAEAEFRSAAEIGERVLPPEDPDRAWPLFGLGRVAAARGRPGEAVPRFEEALARWDVGTNTSELRDLRRELVRALWAEGRDRPRALQLAREGLADDPDDEELRELVRRHAR